MGKFLEMIQERLEEAKSRLTSAQQAFQAANAEVQAATAEFSVWNNALNFEMKAEEKRAAAAQAAQIPMNLPGLSEEQMASAGPEPQSSDEEPTPGVNKTEKVREIIRARDAGITPAELWVEVRDCVSSRAYLYSILKRLRDNDEVSVRRGKYFIKAPILEVKSPTDASQTIQ